MISINKLPQAKKNLEQDLKRIYDSVCKTLSEEVSDILSGNFGLPFELPRLVSMTEDELMDFLIEKENPELSEDERKEFKEEVKEKISKKGWKSFYRFLSILNRYRRYMSPFPRVQAAWLTLSYDMIVHPIIFSNWHWKDFDGFGLDQFSITLSPKEVYDGLRNCNPDMVSVCISNLEHCSIADKEILQEAFDNDQRVVFIDKLKTMSPSDYYCLGLITSWFHYEKALLSFDWETLKILFYHMDFGDEVGIDLSGLPNEDCMDLIVEFDENDPSEDNFIAFCDAFCESLEPLVNLLISNVYSYLKYRLPSVIESIKPFPFERKYLDDVLSIPEVKSILDELPENPDERNMAPDDQEQPEEDAALPEGQKTSKAGNKPKPWIKVSMNEDVIKKKLEEEVWFGIKDEIEALDYLGRSGAKRDTVKKSFGAAFMFYSAYSLGLTVEKQYSKSAERAFRFLPGPRTSVNEYLDKLHLWFTTLYEAQISRKGNIDRNTFKQWKSIDKFKAEFIIKNYIKLCPLFNNTKYLLGKALRIETGLELEGPGQSSDSVLGGAERYNDNVEIKNDGHHSKTALPLSYSNDD